MCDTVFAPAEETADGIPIFGKNSDREPNEAHAVVRIPAATHPPGSSVQCTYITIPQVEQTNEVLLAKPFWMWGAEMGANEHGVTIGNEAIFTRVPYEKESGLTGMDLLRLALERAGSAREALDVITELLAEHGQGGNCGFQHKFYYHNSFIIADPTDAWVLETAGQQWAAEQIHGVRTISNGITIGDTWDLASDDLVNYAVDRGWCANRDNFHFGRCYSDFLYTSFSYCHSRQQCTTDILNEERGAITVKTIMDALRNHGSPSYQPAYGLTGAVVCKHAAFGPIRADQTTGSMVSVLDDKLQTHYVTGTAAPCTSIFKPIWLGADLPEMGPAPDGTYNEAALFWRHERLHRATMRNHAVLQPLYDAPRDTLERDFIAGAEDCAGSEPDERAAYSRACFSKADTAEADWLQQVEAHPAHRAQGPLYRLAWRGFNKAASMR